MNELNHPPLRTPAALGNTLAEVPRGVYHDLGAYVTTGTAKVAAAYIRRRYKLEARARGNHVWVYIEP